MGVTVLDCYDYEILPGIIRISVDSTSDPDLVDILSEITRSDGKIYVEGMYYLYLDYRIYERNGESFIDLEVVELSVV